MILYLQDSSWDGVPGFSSSENFCWAPTPTAGLVTDHCRFLAIMQGSTCCGKLITNCPSWKRWVWKMEPEFCPKNLWQRFFSGQVLPLSYFLRNSMGYEWEASISVSYFFSGKESKIWSATFLRACSPVLCVENWTGCFPEHWQWVQAKAGGSESARPQLLPEGWALPPDRRGAGIGWGLYWEEPTVK